MRTQAVSLLLLALVCASQAASFAEMSPLMGGKLPRNILSEIAARIASEGPLDDIYGLFDTLTSNIRAEQVEHDQLYDKQSAECKVEIAFREKEVADAEAALGAAGQELNACTTSRAQNKAELDTNLKTQQDVESNVQILDQQRAAEKARFDEQSGQHTAALNALDEGHRILQELYTGSATLIDLSRVTVQLFKHSVAISASQHYAPVLGALAQIAQKADLLVDPSILQRVEDLFKQLHESLEGQLKTLEDEESASIEDYQQNRERLTTQLDGLKKAENTLRDNIANYDQCIVKANNIIAQASAKKERNSQLLGEAQTMCKNFEEEYQVANQQRKEELELIGKLRTIVQSKLSGLTQQVTQRASEYQNEFKAYENQAKISDEQWKKGENTYNARGAELAGYKRDQNLEKFIQVKA